MFLVGWNFRGVLIEFLGRWNFRGILMKFLGGWNKEEGDEEGDGIILVFFFGETLGLGLCFGFVLTFTVLVWFWIVLRL